MVPRQCVVLMSCQQQVAFHVTSYFLSLMGRVEVRFQLSLFQLVMSWEFLCSAGDCAYVRVLGEVRPVCS